MTTDDVVLRRDKAAENGEAFREPPPRIRGQTTYLALLSSLATDLDIMLNDLRSSPSSRLSSNPHHLHPSSTAGYTPFSLNIGNDNNGSSSNNATNQSNNYLQNAAIHNSATSNYPGNNEQNCNRDEFGNVEYNNDCYYRTNQWPQQESQQLLPRHKDNQTSESLLVTVKQEKLNQALSANCNQQQQHFNQNATDNGSINNCQREQHRHHHQLQSKYSVVDNSVAKYPKIISANCSQAKNGDIATATVTATATATATTTISSASSSFQGFSTDTPRISKLPLYTYQRKQLQQPQTLHIKLLQQQQATKAIASQMASTTLATASPAAHMQQHILKKHTTKMNDSATTNNGYNTYGKSSSSSGCGIDSIQKQNNCTNVFCKATCTRTTTTNPLTTTPYSSVDFRIKSITSSSTTASSSPSSSSISSSLSSAAATGKSAHIYKISSSCKRSGTTASWLQSTSAFTSSASTRTASSKALVSSSTFHS